MLLPLRERRNASEGRLAIARGVPKGLPGTQSRDEAL